MARAALLALALLMLGIASPKAEDERPLKCYPRERMAQWLAERFQERWREVRLVPGETAEVYELWTSENTWTITKRELQGARCIVAYGKSRAL